jgi:pimeloyl-ACP methyl ester carboxylesterase
VRRMLTTIKDSEIVDIPDAGHSVPLDNPPVFNATVRSYLDRR